MSIVSRSEAFGCTSSRTVCSDICEAATWAVPSVIENMRPVAIIAEAATRAFLQVCEYVFA
mgnify:CR=1 FL=1